MNNKQFINALTRHFITFVFLAVILISCQPILDAEDSFRFEDRVRIAEAFHIAENYCEEIWPGWAEIPLSLLFLTADYEFLIHHPNPTADFQSMGYDSLLEAEVLYRKRIFPERLLAAFQAVNNESSILMGTPEITERHSTAWTITLLHEHFHQLQYSQPGYFDKSKALDLARGDSTAMWMLNFDFPYGDEEVAQHFQLLGKQLLELLHRRQSLDEDGFEAYLQNKTTFRELIGEENFRYMQFQLWQEGVALYTEWKLLEKLNGVQYQPSADFMTLKDYMPFDSLQYQIYQRIIHQLENMNMPEWKRVSFYAFGAAEALLLDYIRPGWREHYFENMFGFL
jgi:hypothetical protein